KTISKEDLLNLKIPLPPLQEQKEIAEFLDSKCEKIQNYIDKKQKLITLLQEKKQALINEAVTKGLNPNIESKNSGIEYLGLIPHHWEVVKVKYIATTNIGLVYDPSEIATNENVGYPVLRANNIQNGKIDYKDVIYVAKKIDDKQLAISGDLLMCVRNGSENLLGKTAKIENNNFSFGAFTAIIRSDLNNYLYWIFQTEMLKKSISSFIVSIGIGQISQDDIKNFKIPLPPLQEQKEIAEFLDKKCEKINSAIEKTKRQIELIKEYKNTLINEAVCGRINLERK
ncbi:restriction endonuclease subunit S, partial [Campylobacter helveticus]